MDTLHASPMVVMKKAHDKGTPARVGAPQNPPVKTRPRRVGVPALGPVPARPTAPAGSRDGAPTAPGHEWDPAGAGREKRRAWSLPGTPRPHRLSSGSAWRRRDPTRRLRGWERRDLRDGGGVRWAHEWGRRHGSAGTPA